MQAFCTDLTGHPGELPLVMWLGVVGGASGGGDEAAAVVPQGLPQSKVGPAASLVSSPELQRRQRAAAATCNAPLHPLPPLWCTSSSVRHGAYTRVRRDPGDTRPPASRPPAPAALPAGFAASPQAATAAPAARQAPPALQEVAPARCCPHRCHRCCWRLPRQGPVSLPPPSRLHVHIRDD